MSADRIFEVPVPVVTRTPTVWPVSASTNDMGGDPACRCVSPYCTSAMNTGNRSSPASVSRYSSRARLIAAVLQNPAPHNRQIYPLVRYEPVAIADSVDANLAEFEHSGRFAVGDQFAHA